MDLTTLTRTLALIAEHDTDYPARYGLVLRALHEAHEAGLQAGVGWDDNPDPELDGYRAVVYIELPTGQISWHMPEHGRVYDGHSTETKYGRIRAL